MSKKRKKGSGTSSLTLIIRLLIVAIFVASVIIAFNRITEAIHNDEKKNELEKKVAAFAVEANSFENF